MKSSGTVNFGVTVENATAREVTLRMHSREATVRVRLTDGERDPLLKEKIDCRYAFFNHMLETLAWRACLNIEVETKSLGYALGHVVCEDTGWALGAAFLHLYQQRLGAGVQGSGFSIGVMDEVMCRCALSFEGRARCLIDSRTDVPERVEDMSSHDLAAFWDGLANGSGLTLHLDILKGKDPHHMWEAAFRTLGESLKAALAPCPWRAGTTPGVKGF